jgi:hypothetical protein
MCEALILPTMMYGLETWAVTIKETNIFRIFERKVVRNIYGSLKADHWRIRTNRGKGHVRGGRYSKIYKIPPA